jgi:signal transduction histidine kinase/CheY-like chemotaxis protein
MSLQSGRGLTMRANFSFRKKDGVTFPGEIIAGYYRDTAGTPLGYIAIIRDMSEEVAREEAKRQSQKLESLGQLTGGIAHDFNNILTTIIGNHEYLKERLTKPEEQHALRRANNAAEMAARLTTRLLTFARRRQLEPVSLNLNEVVSVISELLRRTIGESVLLELTLAHDLAYVRADISEIENVIINLALNGRDAMPNGGRLTIATSNVEFGAQDTPPGLVPGAYVLLSVIDTGVGMTPEIMARAFEPFFSTKGTGRGTGLGLSTVYGFAEQSGGSVSLDSTPGKGTMVRVLLPAVRQLRHETVDEADVPLAPNAEVVLVVEDDPGVRETTLRRVEALGYVAVEACNSAAAIDILQSGESIDVVFSDVVMPGGMSGYELASWIKTNRPDVKILLTSGHVGVDHADSALREQFELLDKPYSRAKLAQAFRAILSGATG